MLVLFLFLHLSCLTLHLLIAAVFVIKYDIKCFTYLVIAYISYSAHILFEYKFVLIIL